MTTNNPFLRALKRTSTVQQIVIGLVLGVLLYIVSPSAAKTAGIFGDMFVGALKAVAPFLVFVLVTAAITKHQKGNETHIKPILLLYLLGTLGAALVAVAAGLFFPTELKLIGGNVDSAAPSGIGEVLKTVLLNLVDNPIKALSSGNYIGILAWALMLGFALRHASAATRSVVADMADAVSNIVGWVIRFAPLGIFGLISATLAATGFGALKDYFRLLVVLVGCMLFVAFVFNPLIVWWKIKKNPYPLVWTCLKESGLIAFVIRSSVANIPANLNLCKKLGLNEETYAVTIPLGATMNMEGASITITILTLAAVHTLGIHVDFITAFLLVIIAVIGACGASGIPGGALPLVPMACSLFNISNDVAMQMVTIGLIISVVQDPCGTLLNSSTDVVFTAAADPVYRHREVVGQVETAA